MIDVHQRRWAEQPAGATPEELTAGALFRQAEPPPLPSAAVFAAIQRRVTAAPERSPLPWVKLALAAASVCLTLELGVAMVRYGPAIARRVLPATSKVRGPIARASPSTREMASPLPAPALEPLLPLPALAAELAQPSAPAALPLGRPRSPIAPAPLPAPPPESALSREAEALAPAVGALNQRGDAAEALKHLARYRSQFPGGALAKTADLLELRAWLASGDDASALVRLNKLASNDFEGVAGATELRVLRAELLAQRGQAESAVSAFDGALGRPLTSELRERALFGRGSALERLGHTAAGREALAAYLAEFPRGRFAVEARQALGRAL